MDEVIQAGGEESEDRIGDTVIATTVEEVIAATYDYAISATAAYATAEDMTTGVTVMGQEWGIVGEKQGFTMGSIYKSTVGRGEDSVKIARGSHTLCSEGYEKQAVQQSIVRGPYEKPTRLKSVTRRRYSTTSDKFQSYNEYNPVHEIQCKE